jgi:hydrogenase nickel incorporation protein HypA/HybF
MHEAAIASELVRQVCETAASHQGGRVQEVHVRLGALRQIVPEALQMTFAAAAMGTAAQDAELTLSEERALAVCRACECMFLPDPDSFRCPQCDQADARIIAGNDVVLLSVICEDLAHVGVS